MNEKSILFSAPMVQAILAGNKTQTRRMVKPQPPEDCADILVGWHHPLLDGREWNEVPT